MDPNRLNDAARKLKELRSAGEILRFRRTLSKDEARAAISSASLSAVERGAILLCLAFRDTDPRWYKPSEAGDGGHAGECGAWIVAPGELACGDSDADPDAGPGGQ